MVGDDIGVEGLVGSTEDSIAAEEMDADGDFSTHKQTGESIWTRRRGSKGEKGGRCVCNSIIINLYKTIVGRTKEKEKKRNGNE